ncbi:unnamed protein product, partial [Didymodactylos carnosus]
RIDGHWRDTRYCDVFHACVAGAQRRSYGCPQVGERFYFDDQTQRCEFASQNPNGCSANSYYSPIEEPTPVSGSLLSTSAPTEPWKIFIQSREQFTCAGKQDGFFASRWCNVFYRCFTGVSNAFLCPRMVNGPRLWWVQHGSPQGISQESAAACTWPCETGRRCTSPGGIIVDSGSSAITESQQEAEAVFQSTSFVCTAPGGSGSSGSGSGTQSSFSSGGSGSGTSGGSSGSGSVGTGTGSFNPSPSGGGSFNTGGGSSGAASGSFNPGSSGTGSGNFGTAGSGTGVVGGGSVSGSFGTGSQSGSSQFTGGKV